MIRFTHIPHPHASRRIAQGPILAHLDEHVGFGAKLGARITAIVGTMLCALGFALLAIIALPGALATHDPVVIVAWVSQAFLQLVLLPVIIVGQNVQGRASDKRAIQTYQDAEAILHECLQVQAHLAEQDAALNQLIGHLSIMQLGSPPNWNSVVGGAPPGTLRPVADTTPLKPSKSSPRKPRARVGG